MNKIDTSKWENFLIDDLFVKLNLKMKKNSFNKATDVSLVKTDEYSLPLVNAKHSNNGIMYYGKPEDYESASMTIDIVADGAASTGDVYAQPQNTGVLYNAYLIKLSNYSANEYILLFLSCVLQKTIKQKFGYNNKCGWEKLKKLTIKLPVDGNHQPNFSYMESYMRNLENVVGDSLTKLQSVLY